MASPVVAVDVVPARDEQARIAGRPLALASQSTGADAFEVIVILDDCSDCTAEIARSTAAADDLRLTMLDGPRDRTGAAGRDGPGRVRCPASHGPRSARTRRRGAARLRVVHHDDPDPAHHHFAGASLSITAAAYDRLEEVSGRGFVGGPGRVRENFLVVGVDDLGRWPISQIRED